MFDNHTSSFREALDTFPSGVGIGNVVVRQFFALQLHSRDQRAWRWVQIAIESCCLVRVLAIAQVLQFHKAAIGLRWIFCASAVFQVVRRQIVADGSVVIADAIEGRHRQGKARFFRHFAAGFEFCNDAGVLRCIGEHRHVFPVFGGTAHHGGTANVNVLDGIF